MKWIVAKKQKFRDELSKAKTVDVEESLKRKRACHANENRVLKKRRTGTVPGFSRNVVYVWLDQRVIRWFEEARQTKFCVTPKI